MFIPILFLISLTINWPIFNIAFAQDQKAQPNLEDKLACEKAHFDYLKGEVLSVQTPNTISLVNVGERRQFRTIASSEFIDDQGRKLECQLSTGLDPKTKIEVTPGLKLKVVEPLTYVSHATFYIIGLQSDSGRNYRILCDSKAGFKRGSSAGAVMKFLVKNQFGLSKNLNYEKDVCSTVKLVPAADEEALPVQEVPTAI